MWSQPICPICKSGNLEPGTLGPADHVYFRSKHTRFLRLGNADIEVTANLCLDCGSLTLHAETSEAKSLAHAVSAFALRELAPEQSWLNSQSGSRGRISERGSREGAHARSR